MRAFAALYETLDNTTSTNEKVAAMVDYFTSAAPADAAWALFFLTGRRFKRFISSRILLNYFLRHSGTQPWLYAESHEAVGDTAETISLLLDVPQEAGTEVNVADDDGLTLAGWIETQIIPLQKKSEEEQFAAISTWWKTLSRPEIYMVNKLLLGAFRVGVSQTLVTRALAQVAGQEPATIAHRMMGNWEPTAAFYEMLVAEEHHSDDDSRPYPFFLAYQLDQDPEKLGNIFDWQIEWKWDGIRAQLIKRNGAIYIWSRGEDLITERFPELCEAAAALPDGSALDGEILAYDRASAKPFPFSVMQTRIGRKTLGKKILAAAPAIFMAYDLLEQNHVDLRPQPLRERRRRMTDLIWQINANQNDIFKVSEAVTAESWEQLANLREESRERGVEGFILKKLDSAYQTGRKKGDWWRWKIDPFTVDAVLIYAQAGSGKRGNLYTDYTFAVWDAERLVPVAKAYSGLSNEEIEKLDRWIRAHTLEKFGPVRSVEAHHVFELAFENIAASSRHKSGVALRFPRIARWRHDKPKEEADTLERLKELIHAR